MCSDEITSQRDLLTTYENNIAMYEGENARKRSLDESATHGDGTDRGLDSMDKSHMMGAVSNAGSMGKVNTAGLMVMSVSGWVGVRNLIGSSFILISLARYCQ